MAGRDGGGPVAAGAVILASFVACDVLATVRVRSKALPIAIAAHAAGPALMLLTKPGTAERRRT